MARATHWQRPRDAKGHFTKRDPLEVLADAESELRNVDHQLTQLQIRTATPGRVQVVRTQDLGLLLAGMDSHAESTAMFPHPAPEHFSSDTAPVPNWLWCAFFFAAGWCVAMLVNLGWSR